MIGVGDFQANDAVRQNVQAVLDSGRLTYGPFTQQAESRIAALHDCKYGIAVSSGTAALHIALLAMKEVRNLPPTAEVIVPATTFVATINTVLHAGLVPRLVDVAIDTGLMDITELARAVNKNTAGIIPVHLFGQAAPMIRIMEIAKAHNLFVIEDSCEAVMATHQGRAVGSFGEFGCFSTYVAHHIPAGIGGFLTTNDDKLRDIARSLVNHGRDIAYFNPDMRQPGMSEVQFLFHRAGLNYRSTEIISAIVCGLLDSIHEIIDSRRRLARLYQIEFNALDKRINGMLQLEYTVERPMNYHSWMMFPILAEWCDSVHDKFRFMEYLWSHGIDTRETLPLINQPYLAELIKKDDRHFPVAEYWNRVGLYLPCHQYMSMDEPELIVSTIEDYMELNKIIFQSIKIK